MNFPKAIAIASLAAAMTGCIDKHNVTQIGDAENILFLEDGRLLVSGGNNIYQVSGNGNDFTPTPLYVDESGKALKCNFTGIAQHGDWVISSCVETKWLIFTNNHLLAANVNDSDFKFNVITPSKNDVYDQLALPNGIAFTKDGSLLVADYNLFATSGIAKLTLDFSGPQPFISSLEEDFIGVNHGLSSPNGVRTDDNYVYVSNGNAVKRYAFAEDGTVPTTIEINGLAEPNETLMWKGSLATIVDDIMPYCGGVALTSYLNGSVKYVKRQFNHTTGQEEFVEIADTGALAFNSPSSIAIGQPPLFSGYDLLVTEKGLLQEKNSSFGNRLSTATMPFDLNSANACDIVASLD
ncbi:hypothetical protein [Litoribacillus peritrichatus]|uniref:Uncharacterized protein n=1 Tax=Litoribacillus peritrichatus TaxID=718191 RepID=A0ABP7MFJ9_9GAMM